MADSKARAWAQRLLRGDIRDGDLQGLFLYARDRPDGRDVVTEVGDFAAHHTERQKGMITKSARDWVAIVRFHSTHNFGNGPPLDVNRLPPITPRYISAMFDRLGDDAYRKIGLRRASAFKMLKSVLALLHANADGTLKFIQRSGTEFDLFQLCCNILMVESAFNGEKLSTGIIEILRSASVLSREEIRGNPSLHTLFQLYALSVMHNASVTVDNEPNMRLELTQADSGLLISTAVALPNITPRLSLSSPIFATKLSAPQYCQQDLLFNMSADRAIEVKDSGLLGFID